MQERFRDESTKETGEQERARKYFERFFNYKNFDFIQQPDSRHKQAVMYHAEDKNIALFNDNTAGEMKLIPSDVIVDGDVLFTVQKLQGVLKDTEKSKNIGETLDNMLEEYVEKLNEISNMQHAKYKKEFCINDRARKYNDNTAYINPRKIRNICERGTTGNLCYSYNYATGQMGLHVYRGDKWGEDIATRWIPDGKIIDENGKEKTNYKRVESFREKRPMSNENNFLVAQIIDRIMQHATNKLLVGGLSDRRDMERIVNGATGMPVVYMGMALLDCPADKEEAYTKIPEKELKEDINKCFYDYSDFFRSDEKDEELRNEEQYKLERNFFSFEDCGKKEKSSFGERVEAFRAACKKVNDNKMSGFEKKNRFISKDLDYVTGPCDYYSNIQRHNSKDENVLSSNNGLLIGDIDIINVKIEGEKLLISIHEGKGAGKAKFRENGEIKDPKLDMSQEIFYRLFINMLRIGTEDLKINIEGVNYPVELDSKYNNIHGVSGCEVINKKIYEMTTDDDGKDMFDKDTLNEHLKNTEEYIETSGLGKKSKILDYVNFMYETKKIKEAESLTRSTCHCYYDEHVLPGLDLFSHCNAQGVNKYTDTGTNIGQYELKTTQFIQEYKNGKFVKINHNPNGNFILIKKGYFPNKNPCMQKWKKEISELVKSKGIKPLTDYKAMEQATAEMTKVLAYEYYEKFYNAFSGKKVDEGFTEIKKHITELKRIEDKKRVA